MSCRNFLLGESTLERKCRCLFGMTILVVVGGCFFWYGQKLDSLVLKQTTETARMLVNPALLSLHFESLGKNGSTPILDDLATDLGPVDELPTHAARFLATCETNDLHKQPRDEFERAMIARFIRSGAGPRSGLSSGKARKFADGSPSWTERITNGRKELQYIQAVFFKSSCLMSCHGQQGEAIADHLEPSPPDGQPITRAKVGDLAGAVVINLPMEPTYKAIHSSHAILITAALITAILAMVSSYLIIRYVVVRPLKLGLDV